MTKFWTDLSFRERLLVGIGGAIFTTFFVFQFVYSPFSDWRKSALARADRSKEVYQLVSKASALGGTALGDEDRDIETPLRDALTQTASPSGINLNFVNTRPDGQIDASAASTDPDDLFTWLETLERRYDVTVENADVARERGQSGAVRAQLTFSR